MFCLGEEWDPAPNILHVSAALLINTTSSHVKFLKMCLISVLCHLMSKVPPC